jgi:protein SCO1/2
MFTKRQTAAIYVVAALTTVFAGTVTYMEIKVPQAPTNAQTLDRYAALPDFALTNQDGEVVTLDDLKGKVWLADFVYTSCPGPCPLISAHMSQLQTKLPAGDDVGLVSFSTDPTNDTPRVLKGYARRFNASRRWMFLTGPKGQVYDLINHGFLLAVGAAPGAPIIHSTRIALVDRSGEIRAYFDGATMEADGQIVADVQTLLKE